MPVEVETAVGPEAVRAAGIVIAAALAAAAILAPTARGRGWAMLGALALTPVLLVLSIWETPQLEIVREHTLPALAAALAGAALVIVPLALLFARRRSALPLAALATLPFRVPIEAGGATANLLVPLYLVIAAGALAWAVPRIRGGERFDPPRANGALEWLLTGATVLYTLQASYSTSLDKALEQTVFFYVPFALLFAVLRDIDWSARLLRAGLGVLVALALLFVAIGFVEYATRSLLLNPKVIASNELEEYFRVNSLFFDPNIYGRFLALVMLGLAAVLLWERRPRTAAAAALALAVLWGGLLLTLSQSSFAGLLAGLLVLAALRYPVAKVLPAIVALAVAGAVLVLAFPSALRLELGDAESLDDATSGRYELMRGGVELAGERPLWGWGSGAFAEEYLAHGFGAREDAVAASHTIPLTVAAEQGAIGLAVYLALLAAALARLLRHARDDPYRAVVAAGFAAVVLHTWLYAAFLEDPVTWTLLAVGAVLARHPRGSEGALGTEPPGLDPERLDPQPDAAQVGRRADVEREL
ncbi:MAG TPA: O-antigen ligase family protein [Solirubrobacteraceae bacterium]|nr:O-antigen ligase family protein [Solirubrobacteraceae bacterium]